MANNIWSNYTEKTATPVDADEVMVRDSTDGKTKDFFLALSGSG